MTETAEPEPGILLQSDEGPVRVLTLNRPERSNALSRQLYAQLSAALADAEADPAVRVIVITGAGRSFCAGVDMKEPVATAPQASGKRPSATAGHPIFELMVQMQTPIIAALNGHAMGGGLELALACDLRVGSTTARLGFPEARRGMGAAFATVVLPRIIPFALALEMLYTGAEIDAARATELGLLNRAVAPDQVLASAMDTARLIADNAPLSIRRMRANAWGTCGLPLVEALRLSLGPDPYTSEDRLEGARAFVERRPPVWRNR